MNESKAIFTLTGNAADFVREIERLAGAAMMSIHDATRMQVRLLCKEFIDRTPPFSGKTIKKMVAAREGAMFTDFEIENSTALAVGKRRVEKDIRKVIYGLEGAQLSARHMAVSRGRNPGATDWGTLQKCQGKQAVRVFATKKGEVYGADVSQWFPGASLSDLATHHNANRTKRGRVTMAGQRTVDVGRWKWLNVFVTTEAIVKKYVAKAQGNVGQGKGGWVAGFLAMGGKLSTSGWVGRHAKTGTCHASFGERIEIVITNNSRWAEGGDPDRIMEASVAGRLKAMEGDIRRRLEKIWGSRARRNAAEMAKEAAKE